MITGVFADLIEDNYRQAGEQGESNPWAGREGKEGGGDDNQPMVKRPEIERSGRGGRADKWQLAGF